MSTNHVEDTPEEDTRTQAKKPTTPELDSAGWLRLGQMAAFTGQSLAQTPTTTNTNTKQASATVDNPGHKPGLLAQIALQTVDRLKKEWQWFWHPLQSLRRWVAEVMSVQQGPVGNQGTVIQPGQTVAEALAKSQPAVTPEAKATVPDKAPRIEDTWAQLKDRLFESASNPQADPAHVVPGIVAAIPDDHRVAIAERLFALAEMAQEAAKALSAREMAAKESGKSQSQAKGNMPKGQESIPLPECPPEVSVDIPDPDQEPRLKRQVPAQPLPKRSQAQQARAEAEKAQKAVAPNKAKAAQR